MRHVAFTAVLVASGLAAGSASAAPFEPALLPDQVGVVGHLDVDALRRTQIFAAAGGQAAIDAALDHAPSKLQPVVRALSRAIRGISFWHDAEDGAVYLDAGDARSLGQLIAQLPTKPAAAIDGFPAYTLEHGDKDGFCAVYGHTLVLAHSHDSLERSIHVLAGKAPNLAGSRKLPAASRQGVFVFVTIGDNALGAIQKSAQAKVLQLGLRSVMLDVSESGGQVVATARAEMRSADALQKARSIIEGIRTMASLSDDPDASKLVNAVTVTTSGLGLDVSAALPVAEVARLIQSHHGKARH